jgi:NAD(P)H-hydrate epimerase
MSRLTGQTIAEVQTNRWGLAWDKAHEWNCVVLLKGAHTVIAAPDGQMSVLPFKNPVLATAGSGDILAGVIVSLLGQGITPFEAACAAGYVHGLTGEIVAEHLKGDRGSSAATLLEFLPATFTRLS